MSGKRKRDVMTPLDRVAANATPTGSFTPIGCDGPHPFKKGSWDPQRKGHGVTWPKLKKIYTIDFPEDVPTSEPNHGNIGVPPSTLPAKKYCDITGYEAPYTHRSGIRYADAEVYQFISEHLDSFDKQQEVLDMRGASTRIK